MIILLLGDNFIAISTFLSRLLGRWLVNWRLLNGCVLRCLMALHMVLHEGWNLGSLLAWALDRVGGGTLGAALATLEADFAACWRWLRFYWRSLLKILAVANIQRCFSRIFHEFLSLSPFVVRCAPLIVLIHITVSQGSERIWCAMLWPSYPLSKFLIAHIVAGGSREAIFCLFLHHFNLSSFLWLRKHLEKI